ncbi:MAG: glycosyltransferase family 9 protein [Gemmatimonadaceae bacterium]
MNIPGRRAARRFYAALYPLYRTLFPTRVRRGESVPYSVKRVLIVRHDRLGDMIVTTPVFDLLRQLVRGLEIDVLASPRNAVLIASDDRLARIFTDDGSWRALWVLRRDLRARHYDAIFSLIEGRSIRQGWTAGVAARVGTHRVSIWRPKRYHGFFTQVIRVPYSLHAAHVSRRMTFVVRTAFGITGPTPDRSALARPVRIAIPQSATHAAETFIGGHRLGAFVAVNLASTAPARSWSAAECTRFLSVLLERYPTLSVVMVPAPPDVADAEQVRAAVASPRVLIFDPGAPLLDVAALIARAAVMITPDTMTLHLAVATARPVLSLHTATDGNTPGLWVAAGVVSRALVAAEGRPVSSISAEMVAGAFDDLARELGIESRIS